jgi:outer membrane protein assembly factor BamB
VYNGNVLVGNTDGTVYDYYTSCGLNTCSPRWESTATGGPIYGSPAVDNGFIFVGSSDHSVYAYVESCTKSCSPVWKSESTGGAVDGSPVVDGSRVFVLSEDGKLYAFPEQCTTTGCPWAWVSKPMATGINATPSVDNGDVYIGDGTTVYGYPESCSTTCSPVWQSQAEPGIFQGASAIANGVVYVDMPFTTAPSGDLYAFNTSDNSCSPGCAPIWQSGAFSLTTDPAVSEGLVWVGNDDDTLDTFG